MQDVYKNIKEYNSGRKCNVLIVFDVMIADMIRNKKLRPILIELFIIGRKLNISAAFITQFISKYLKMLDARLLCTFFLLWKSKQTRASTENREAVEISTLSSGKIEKPEYLTNGEILPPNQSQIIEQEIFTYSPLGKVLEKKKAIEDTPEK